MINEIQYQADQNMSWEEWINSTYNPGEFYISTDTPVKTVYYNGKKLYSSNVYITYDEIIEENKQYYFNTDQPSHSGGGA